MCGICGIINLNGNSCDEMDIRSMMLAMKHRGQDDEGVFLNKEIGMGFVRLSILDLSVSGHQPMTTNDGRYSIVFNGEIFNYIELREELILKGYVFKTRTDTEVLLYSFIEWGKKCLDKLNGMWAFAIHDCHKNEIFISRDRYGIKPLYYIKTSDFFAFASEIPPLLKILGQNPTPNMNVIFDFLTFNRTDHTENTFFNEIKKLNHGFNIEIKRNELKYYVNDPYQWYDLKLKVGNGKSISTVEFKELFEEAIKIRLRSDVPLGVCLSGGIDSSAIVSMLSKVFNISDIYTFSAIYNKGQVGDESEFINLYSNEIDNMFFAYPDGHELLKDISKFVKVHAEPIPSTSPYAQFKVMELASKRVKVTLDGQGADEFLGGYHYFFGFYFKDLLLKLRLLKFTSEIFYYVFNHKSLLGIKTLFFFLLPVKFRTRIKVNEKGYLNENFIKKIGNQNLISSNLYASKNLQEALINHFEYKLEHLLKWEDRNSMYHSVEARVPFLDHVLVEKVLSLDSGFIIKKGTTKFILRDSLKGILPEKIRLRKDKVGFGTPQDEWFRQPEFRYFIFSVINSEKFKNRGIFKSEVVESLYKRHINGEINISKEIWKWIHLELWFREFIDLKKE